MSAASNAAAFLFIHKDKKLREWQLDVDLHRLATPAKSAVRPVAGPRVTYRTRRVIRTA